MFLNIGMGNRAEHLIVRLHITSLQIARSRNGAKPEEAEICQVGEEK